MSKHQTLCIDSKTAHRTIEQYFTDFNQQQFSRVATLFAADGEMHPPFEGAITGPDAIERYLQKSASDMTADPQQWEIEPAEDGSWQLQITGKVTAIVFRVNVRWQFRVLPSGEIASARIKLLASPKELLNLRSAGHAS